MQFLIAFCVKIEWLFQQISFWLETKIVVYDSILIDRLINWLVYLLPD